MVYAIITAISFAISSWHLNYIIKSGMRVDLANYNSTIVTATFYLIISIYRIYYSGSTNFTLIIFGMTFLEVCFFMAALILFSFGLKFGKGGTVHAISETKTII